MHVMPRVRAAAPSFRSFLLKSSGAKNWPLGCLIVMQDMNDLYACVRRCDALVIAFV